MKAVAVTYLFLLLLQPISSFIIIQQQQQQRTTSTALKFPFVTFSRRRRSSRSRKKWPSPQSSKCFLDTQPAAPVTAAGPASVVVLMATRENSVGDSGPSRERNSNDDGGPRSTIHPSSNKTVETEDSSFKENDAVAGDLNFTTNSVAASSNTATTTRRMSSDLMDNGGEILNVVEGDISNRNYTATINATYLKEEGKEKNQALHELEHRVKHATAIEGSKMLAENLARLGERRAVERAVERAGERVAERAVQRTAEQTGERVAERLGKEVVERTGERITERVAETTAERMGERIVERFGKEAVGRAGERVAERAVETTGERIAERAGKEAAERVGERIAERAAGASAKRMGERTAERVGKGAAERAGERIAERAAERTGERIAERTGERIAERATERLAERTGESNVLRTFLSRLGKREAGVGTKTAERLGEQLVERTTERSAESVGKGAATATAALERRVAAAPSSRLILRRLGRGAQLIIPVLGGVFAFYMLRMDLDRAQAERNNLRAKTQQSQSSNFVWLIFAGAAFADGLDTVSHIVIASALLTNALSHHHLKVVETVSLVCAVASTAFAVGGEILSKLPISNVRVSEPKPEESCGFTATTTSTTAEEL